MEYHVVRDTSYKELQRTVKIYLEAGWTLQGGVSVGHSSYNGSVYAQAMVKESQ